jgi:uncharacterized damage-inducible protein DinB
LKGGFIMAIIDAYIQELQAEAPSARNVIARIPDDQLAWRPHPKSMSFAELGSHIAESLGWTPDTLDTAEFDIPPDWKPAVHGSTAEILAHFDANLSAALAAMAGRSDAELMEPWTLKLAGQTMFTAPRVAVLRNFLLNHLVHHRAQLGLYLRLNDIPVPSVYGPTADEQPGG